MRMRMQHYNQTALWLFDQTIINNKKLNVWQNGPNKHKQTIKQKQKLAALHLTYQFQKIVVSFHPV